MPIKPGLITLLLLSVLGCHQSNSTNEFVARVGESYLLHSDIIAKLEYLPAGLDTIEAKSQIIQQWIHDELLYQEALRQGLPDQQDIQKRLHESTRSVLIDGIISEFNKQSDNAISPTEIKQYYDANIERLHFFEPFVHIRYLSHPSQDTLMVAMESLLQQEAVTDSVFERIVLSYSQSPVEEIKMTQNYFLESSLFVNNPTMDALLRNTLAGSPPQIVEADSMYHLLQVMDRSPAGAIPELFWIEGFIREQLMISHRNQNYSRHVQRLRLDAQYNDRIEIR